MLVSRSQTAILFQLRLLKRRRRSWNKMTVWLRETRHVLFLSCRNKQLGFVCKVHTAIVCTHAQLHQYSYCVYSHTATSVQLLCLLMHSYMLHVKGVHQSVTCMHCLTMHHNALSIPVTVNECPGWLELLCIQCSSGIAPFTRQCGREGCM